MIRKAQKALEIQKLNFVFQVKFNTKLHINQPVKIIRTITFRVYILKIYNINGMLLSAGGQLMTREDYLKKLIKERGFTLKDFAAKVNIPYTTLLSMLNGYIGGAAVDNVIKICRELGIPVEHLQNPNLDSPDYYHDPTTATMARELFANKDLGILFDASRDLSPDDLRVVIELVNRLKK